MVIKTINVKFLRHCVKTFSTLPFFVNLKQFWICKNIFSSKRCLGVVCSAPDILRMESKIIKTDNYYLDQILAKVILLSPATLYSPELKYKILSVSLISFDLTL